METRPGARIAGILVRLALGAVVGVGMASPAWIRAQTPPPQPAGPVIPAEIPTPSQVFPDGGFPSGPAAEGGIPASAPKTVPNLFAPAPALAPEKPAAEYAPPGLYPRGIQETPGVGEYFRPTSEPLPGYFYQQSYYERPVVSPRSLVEYAPPGYEARDQQVAPGTPEFTLITAPRPVTPEEGDKFVTRGIFPGSFLVPGTNTSFRLRGYVRLMGLYDFNPIGSRDSFVPSTIPVPRTPPQGGENFNYGARYSRIAFETWTPSPINEWTVHTFVEGDFFNGPAQAVGGGGNPFRLRHAFIDYGYFRLGQQNTVFMDASTWPSVVDFQGPAGWANQRRPGLRVTLPIGDKLFWACGIEQPFSDITTNGRGSNVQDVPDFATHVRYETGFGHVQVAGLMRSIGYQVTDGGTTRRAGYGASAGTTFHPWALLIGSNPTLKDNPTGLERCRLIAQATVGRGIARYLQDSAGLGLDGQVDPDNGGFNLPSVTAWVISYEHWYSERWLSALTWSEVHTGSNGDQPAGTYVGGKYLTANLWYIPFRNMSVGLEGLYGERENINGQNGSARRINALVQYNF